MLKKIRVSVEILFVTIFLLVFLDLWGYIPADFKQAFFFFQIIPSLLHAAHADIDAGIGFVLIIILTFFFGRIYCSTICPLGAFQDFIIWLRKKFKKKLRFAPSKNYSVLRYSVLGLALLSGIFGFSLILNFLDPFSIAGKMTNTFGHPLLAVINNFISGAFEHYRIYSYLR